MVTETLEVERKYDADIPVEPSLDGLSGVSAIDGPQRHSLEAVYFDTDDLRLARAGITLRMRTGGDDAGWHLKLPTGAVGARIEVRLPPERSATAVPEELVELTLSRTRGARLRPVGRLRTARTRWRLLDGDGGVLAEVVSDEVTGETVGASGDESAALTHWHEFEVELVHGTDDLLDAIGARLSESGARPSASVSKLGRLLGDRLAEANPPVRPRKKGEPSAGDAVLDYFRTQVEAIVRYDPSVRRDEPDAVHQMRVAARRARSTLQAFRRVLDRERTADLISELRWLGTVLAEARDTEVQRDALLERLRSLPVELVVGPVVSRVDSHFFRVHVKAREAMLAQLRGPRYLALLEALHALLDDPPLTGQGERRAGTVLPGQVRRAQRRVRRAIDRYRADPAGPGRDIALHDARKAAKRARYTAEAATPMIGKPAKRTAKRLKAVQSLLGDYQDGVVARGVLRDLGMRAHLAGENGFSYGLLLGQELDRAARLRDELPQVWRRAETAKACRWMR
jgi:CHAD domain-containing protein